MIVGRIKNDFSDAMEIWELGISRKKLVINHNLI